MICVYIKGGHWITCLRVCHLFALLHHTCTAPLYPTPLCSALLFYARGQLAFLCCTLPYAVPLRPTLPRPPPLCPTPLRPAIVRAG